MTAVCDLARPLPAELASPPPPNMLVAGLLAAALEAENKPVAGVAFWVVVDAPKRAPVEDGGVEAPNKPPPDGRAGAAGAVLEPKSAPVGFGAVMLLACPGTEAVLPERVVLLPAAEPPTFPNENEGVPATGAEPKSPPEAGAVVAALLFDAPDELALPKVKDIVVAMGVVCCVDGFECKDDGTKTTFHKVTIPNTANK